MLIPWEQIGRAEKVRLYWRPAVRLTIGEPRIGEINLLADLWERLAARGVAR